VHCNSGGQPPGVTKSLEVDDLLPGVLGLWANDRWKMHAPTREGMALSATQELLSVEEIPDTGRGRACCRWSGIPSSATATCCRSATSPSCALSASHSRQHKRSTEYVPPKYSEAERAAFRAQYDREYAQRRGHRPLLAARRRWAIPFHGC